MAKKNTRPPSKPVSKTAAAPKKTAAPLVGDPELPAVPVEPKTPARATRPSRKQTTIEQLQDEYSYVPKDLRRVFILAGAMFALLILANLLLPLLGV